MLREIKFRAWNKTNKQWVDSFCIMPGGQIMCYPSSTLYYEGLHEARVTLMQYTGLKDINGIEIYEGDIVENRDYDDNAHAFNRWHRVVEYDRQNTCFTGIEGEEVQIIGNVFESDEAPESNTF